MKQTLLKILSLVLCIFLLQACGGDNSSSGNSNETTTETGDDSNKETSTDNTTSEVPSGDQAKSETTYETPAPFVAKDLLYTWVDKLNIRQTPDLEGKVVASVDSDEAVEVIGDKSGERTIYVLRGVAYDDHWYKVKTKDGDEGWVFGGAVKRENEKKGNAAITDEKFDFPHFGSFDLSGWKKLGTETENDEFDIEITTYEKGGRILEVTKSEMGEFNYGFSYKLMDDNKKVLKERDFNFSADVDQREITEKVRDWTAKPIVDHVRTQKLSKHFDNLNARPVMAFGPWTKVRREANAEEIAALYRGVKSGGKVTLKEMIYYLDRPIFISKIDGFTLEGVYGTSIIMKDPAENVISVVASSNITIDNIDATHIEPEGPLGCTGNVIYVENSTDVKVEYSKLNGSGIIGIVAYDTKNLLVNSNYIYNNSRYGILFDKNTSLKIESNTFEDNGAGGKHHVVKALDSAISEVENINADKNEGNLKMAYNNFMD